MNVAKTRPRRGFQAVRPALLSFELAHTTVQDIIWDVHGSYLDMLIAFPGFVMPAEADIQWGGGTAHGSPPSRGRHRGARRRHEGDTRATWRCARDDDRRSQRRPLQCHARAGGHPVGRWHCPWVPALAGMALN
jgi:hypothetical protein